MKEKSDIQKRKEAQDVSYEDIVLCKQKGCPNEALEFSKYCQECHDEKYPEKSVDSLGKPILIEVFTCNGAHSHWALIDLETGEKLWSEDPEECKAMGHPVVNEKVHNMAACMLSILDSLKLYDNDSLLLLDETLSEVMFRKMKGYNIDLNKELNFTHLEPVKFKEKEEEINGVSPIQFEQPVIKSAFQFKNGVKIIVYTGCKGITTYQCDKNWTCEDEPYATSLGWPGYKSAADYHRSIRTSHGEKALYEPLSTKL